MEQYVRWEGYARQGWIPLECQPSETKQRQGVEGSDSDMESLLPNSFGDGECFRLELLNMVANRRT